MTAGIAPLIADTTTRPLVLAASGGGLSTGAIVIAVVAGLLALGCLAWAIARLRGLEPRWTASLAHAMAEAGYRTSEALAELADWVRLGR
jgi:hypothetical protein